LAYQGVIGDGRFNGTMQNVVGPTLVAMATKFGLGTEIQSPTGLFYYYSAHKHILKVFELGMLTRLETRKNFSVSSIEFLAIEDLRQCNKQLDQ